MFVMSEANTLGEITLNGESVLVLVFCPLGSWEDSADLRSHRQGLTIVLALTRRPCPGQGSKGTGNTL